MRLEIEDLAPDNPRDRQAYVFHVVGPSSAVQIIEAPVDNIVYESGDETIVSSFAAGGTRVYEVTAPIREFRIGETAKMEIRLDGQVMSPDEVISATGGSSVPDPIIPEETNGGGDEPESGSGSNAAALGLLAAVAIAGD